MKKLTAIFLLCCLLLTGCAVKSGEAVPSAEPTAVIAPVAGTPDPTPEPVPEATPAPTPDPIPGHMLTLYAPNEDASGFIYASWELPELSGEAIFAALIEAGVLNADVALNSLSVENGQVNVDVNKAFHTQLCSYGTSGEYVMMGSVVNTLLAAYAAQSVCISCEGEIMETGHSIYDFPLSFYEGY